MNSNFKLWPTISSISTKRTITEKKTQHVSISAISFRGYTQSKKIVNQRIKILVIKKIKMTSKGSQTWLKPPMPEGGDLYVCYVRIV